MDEQQQQQQQQAGKQLAMTDVFVVFQSNELFSIA